MSMRYLILLPALVCLMLSPWLQAEEIEASKLHGEGTALLQKGDFDSALQAFSAAAKAAPDNPDYAQQAMLVRRILTLRKYVNEAELTPQWEKAVVSLHAFYLTQNLHNEALPLDRKAHEKMDNALSASLLAETLLEMGQDTEALNLLSGLDTKKLNPHNRIYLGIAMARTGQKEKAKKIRQTCRIDKPNETGLLFDLARLDTLVGDKKSALGLLKNCFEKTPGTQLAMVKGFVAECPDFKSLTDAPGFEAVMNALSKVNESGCSSGSSCGSCPNRTKCGSQGDASAKKAEKGCGGHDK